MLGNQDQVELVATASGLEEVVELGLPFGEPAPGIDVACLAGHEVTQALEVAADIDVYASHARPVRLEQGTALLRRGSHALEVAERPDHVSVELCPQVSLYVFDLVLDALDGRVGIRDGGAKG